MDPLPEELFRMILDCMDFQEIQSARLVSTHWRNSVSSVCSRKDSIAFVGKGLRVDLATACANDRLFHTVNMKKFVTIQTNLNKLLPPSAIEFLRSMFPNIRHFMTVIKPDLVVVDNLISILNLWPHLCTVSVSTQPICQRCWLPLMDAINTLKKVIRIDISENGSPFRLFNMSTLSPTFARIQHLSLGYCVHPADLLGIIERLGPDCTRLWIRHIGNGPSGAEGRTKAVRECIEANPNLFKQLTHFGFPSSYLDEEVTELIRLNCTSLRVLHVTGLDGTWVRMARLPGITDLRVMCATECAFYGLLNDDLTKPIAENVQIFEFCANAMHEERQGKEKWLIFCAKLAHLCPNVQCILLYFGDTPETVDCIEQNLSVFKNLRNHKLKRSIGYNGGYIIRIS